MQEQSQGADNFRGSVDRRWKLCQWASWSYCWPAKWADRCQYAKWIDQGVKLDCCNKWVDWRCCLENRKFEKKYPFYLDDFVCNVVIALAILHWPISMQEELETLKNIDTYSQERYKEWLWKSTSVRIVLKDTSQYLPWFPIINRFSFLGEDFYILSIPFVVGKVLRLYEYRLVPSYLININNVVALFW